jgi:hypothetical protein
MLLCEKNNQVEGVLFPVFRILEFRGGTHAYLIGMPDTYKSQRSFDYMRKQIEESRFMIDTTSQAASMKTTYAAKPEYAAAGPREIPNTCWVHTSRSDAESFVDIEGVLNNEQALQFLYTEDMQE